MNLEWSTFKNVVVTGSLSIQYLEDTKYYHIKAYNTTILVAECMLEKIHEDALDFEANYKDTSNKPVITGVVVTDGDSVKSTQFDTDGAQIVRVKAAKKGWTYCALPFEITTSVIGSLWSNDLSGTPRGDVVARFYDASDAEVTDPSNQSSIVRTEIDFEPPYDYEIIGGVLRLEDDILPPNNCRLWIVAVPDIPAIYGGSKLMAAGVNLRFLAPQNEFKVDGRVSKLLTYSATTHTNKMRFTMVHEPGQQTHMSVTIELYRQ